ncbi:MAG: autotransporter-associated beta strand repeat-containing protein, partial [Candidatus Omnitrophica bacterium]|nr:autotransporter-associated beta strand repeat-containing protein [Candidatus Omnitrophota bacterium]
TIQTDAGTLTVSGTVTNGANLLTVTGSGNTTISGVIGSGAGGLTKSGTGTLTLSGANTYSGTTTLSAGTLNINNATALGTGTFTISGGTIDNTSGGIITLSNNNVQNWNGDFTFTGGSDLNLGTGTVALSANRQVTVSANTLTEGGVISGSFGLTKAGSGVLTLSGTNTYTGSTTISAGTLNANATAALGDGSATNTLIFTGGTLQAGGTITSPSTRGVTLTSTGLIDTNGQNITINGVMSGAGGLTESGTGTLTLSGTNTYTGLTTISAGTLKLGNNMTLGGNLTISGGTFDANGNTNTVTGLATISGGTYLASTATQTFNGGLTISGGTFTGLSGDVDVNGNLALSSGTLTAPSGNMMISGNFTHSGGTFTHNSGTVILDGNDQTITGSNTFNNLTKTVTGAHTLTFDHTAPQTILGILTLQGAASNLLSLHSDVDGSQWSIDPQGTRSVSYVDIKDSNNLSSTIINPANSVDSGHNTNWFTGNNNPPPSPTPITTSTSTQTSETQNTLDNPLWNTPLLFFPAAQEILFSAIEGNNVLLFSPINDKIQNNRMLLGDILHLLDPNTSDLSISPDSRMAYAVNPVNDTLQVFDLVEGKLLKTFRTGSDPVQLVLSKDVSYMFVYNSLERTIAKVNTSTWQQEKTFTVRGNNYKIKLSPDDSQLIATNPQGKMFIFNTSIGPVP